MWRQLSDDDTFRAIGGFDFHTPSASRSHTSATGTWTGSGSDSSSALGAGGMMGQAGMGTVTWELTQTGPNVEGTVTFSGMPRPNRCVHRHDVPRT